MADIDKALPNDKRPEDEVARRNGRLVDCCRRVMVRDQ